MKAIMSEESGGSSAAPGAAFKEPLEEGASHGGSSTAWSGCWSPWLLSGGLAAISSSQLLDLAFFSWKKKVTGLSTAALPSTKLSRKWKQSLKNEWGKRVENHLLGNI